MNIVGIIALAEGLILLALLFNRLTKKKFSISRWYKRYRLEKKEKWENYVAVVLKQESEIAALKSPVVFISGSSKNGTDLLCVQDGDQKTHVFRARSGSHHFLPRFNSLMATVNKCDYTGWAKKGVLMIP